MRAPRPDYYRQLYCILGLPFDAISLQGAADHIQHAAAERKPCFLSTPNLNFLISSQSDNAFRDSVIHSDLSVADGMPIIWMARLLRIPVTERVAGSDLFEKLRQTATPALSVFFFGGPDGVAETACNKLSDHSTGMSCCGFESPGFGSIDEMSSAERIDRINSCRPDFLVVSLGARKGQAWIERNLEVVNAPVISHLGAVVNFVAGSVKRAPENFSRFGLEWLWRIKEEPGLWKRYARDGLTFLRLLTTRILPLALINARHYPTPSQIASASILVKDSGMVRHIHLNGSWCAGNLQPMRDCFSELSANCTDSVIHLEDTHFLDSACIALLQMLHADLRSNGKNLAISSPAPAINRIFKYYCAGYLLAVRQT